MTQSSLMQREGDSGASFYGFDRAHRLKLWRLWDSTLPIGMWVMMNPSVADETKLDPTLRRVEGFAWRWGWGGYFVGNLFTLVSPYPKALLKQEPNAPMADEALLEMAARAQALVYGWGVIPQKLSDRVAEVALLLATGTPHGAHCVGVNRDGSPRHPLYVSGAADLDPWFFPDHSRQR